MVNKSADEKDAIWRPSKVNGLQQKMKTSVWYISGLTD